MKSSGRKGFYFRRSVLAVILVVCMILTNVGTVRISAGQSGEGSSTGESHRQYRGDGYQVRYEVRDSWPSGFNASVTLENTSDRETVFLIFMRTTSWLLTEPR